MKAIHRVRTTKENSGARVSKQARDQLVTAKLSEEVATLNSLNAQLQQCVAQQTTELETANRESEVFSYSVSHDLRAPVRAMRGFSDAVLEDYGALLPEDGRLCLESIQQGARQIGTLIDDLLAFSHLIRAQLRQQNVDVGKLVRDALKELHRVNPKRKIDIKTGSIPPCHGDPRLLRQVWINLLSNAFKYTRKREQAVIEIGYKASDDENFYFVRDNGTGFDMRYVDEVFGVFRRLHRFDEYEGMGVGLAITQRIIDRHGGRIWAEAKEGVGATFYFTVGPPGDARASVDRELLSPRKN